jgi:hypothetical protein
MKATGPYQTFDPLSAEEFAALEADILERGVLVPIEFDEDGNPLDGHHRLAICQKHGITDYPSVVRYGLSEKEKLAHARKLNMARRHLTREQKQEQIRQALMENSGDSDRKIAKSLQVDHKTIANYRRRLEEGGEIPRQEERTGSNGMRYVPPPKPVLRDSDGGEVPQHLAKLFSQRPEYQRLVNEIRDIKRRVLDLAVLNPFLRLREHHVRQHTDLLIECLMQTEPQLVDESAEGFQVGSGGDAG